MLILIYRKPQLRKNMVTDNCAELSGNYAELSEMYAELSGNYAEI